MKKFTASVALVAAAVSLAACHPAHQKDSEVKVTNAVTQAPNVTAEKSAENTATMVTTPAATIAGEATPVEGAATAAEEGVEGAAATAATAVEGAAATVQQSAQ
ncbi:hypothetical protein ACEE90_01955 [Corynebacterium phoceense]|uniref:hypothetical protein n=1 Tax=Corynebacterium phoceense TaxID=1686286 RepID=UPI001D20D1EB|nr:hypothetical protein [Corynebacterium phoceense]MCQ9333290.1 hypothetical protein [Corynebacterium phoceense]MCQ9337493.1 hypothetical protein [Corynebacterium phoceense]HJG43420.1 hypothetical protein [Corynebacterium phoceense]